MEVGTSEEEDESERSPVGNGEGDDDEVRPIEKVELGKTNWFWLGRES